ncbi:hypothetical protein, partial [Puniceibacterium confluentis]|uniref:hypothetical protein n=1 Tax=Puniceibacterium confluentis TaxID=1958944 RepID=UPI00356AD370
MLEANLVEASGALNRKGRDDVKEARRHSGSGRNAVNQRQSVSGRIARFAAPFNMHCGMVAAYLCRPL